MGDLGNDRKSSPWTSRGIDLGWALAVVLIFTTVPPAGPSSLTPRQARQGA